jgi:cardiolipin synthase
VVPQDRLPRKASAWNPANLLTVSRLVLAPFVVRAILTGNYRRALVLLAVAGVTDGLDGLLARRFGWRTRVGAYLDPIADKALLSLGYLALGVAGVVPWWVVGIIFGRDVLILGFAGAALAFTSRRNFSPAFWGKLSTAIQILTAVAVIADRAFPPAAGCRAWIDALFWPTAAITVWSGVHYAWRTMKAS